MIEAISSGFALRFTRIAPYVLLALLVLWTVGWGRALGRRQHDCKQSPG